MARKIQANIIDDEAYGREYIALLLANEFPEIEITFQAHNVESAVSRLIKQQPDILFLDVELTDGNAFDLLSKVKELASQIIFVTAYEHYAIQAIRNDAVDYLLKPIQKEDFINAVNKALKNLQSNRSIPVEQNTEQKINLPTQHGFKRVNISDIVRCEADSNYTQIYLSDKTKVVVSKTLQEFEQQFSAFNFIRVHHKHLINLKHFVSYKRGKGGQALMSDNSLVDISIRRKNDFMKKIQQPE